MRLRIFSAATTTALSNCAGVDAQLCDRGLARQRRAVGPRGRHRVVRIRDGDDPGGERDRLADQAVGVAGAVDALVGGAHDLADVAQVAADAVEHALADDRVLAHDHPLVVGQRAGLVEDLLRGGELADVVHQRAELHQPPLHRIDVQLVGDAERELDHVVAVQPGVLVVVGEDVAEQHRGAAVGGAELDRVAHALTALARERGEQAGGRPPLPVRASPRRPTHLQQ
jgi:hypothetical protein